MNQTREELEREVLAQYRSLARALKATAEPCWMEIDLTIAQLRTLLVLAEEGPLVIGQIAQRLGVGLSTGGHLVERLVRAVVHLPFIGDHLVATRHELWDERSAENACSACHEDLHHCSSRLIAM